MNNEKIDRRGIAWFIALTFLPTIVLSLTIGSMQDSLADKMIIYDKLFLLTAMFFPGISALIVRKFINKECFKNSMMKFGSWKPYLQVALFIPFLYIIIYAITGLLYPPDFTLKTFMVQAGIEEMSINSFLFTLVFFIFHTHIRSYCKLRSGFWRGIWMERFSAPKLLPLGREKALIILGIIWGLWHLPFVFLIGYGSYSNKIVGGLIFIALITLLGIYIGALTLKNKSTLLASYMHGIFNAQDHGIWTIIFPNYNHLMGGAEGLIGVIVLLPVALYYLRKPEENRAQFTIL